MGLNSSRSPCSPSSTTRDSRRFRSKSAMKIWSVATSQQRAFARALAHGGKRMRIVALAVEAHPFDLHRQHVARGDAALRRLEKREPRPVVADVAERNRRNQRRLDRLGRSFRVPARPRQMSGEHIALEHAALARQRDPGRVQRHHQRLELGHRARHHRRGFVALLQFEPVEAIRRQRDHVGQFADRREARAAEHFQAECGPSRRRGRVRSPAPIATDWRRTE